MEPARYPFVVVDVSSDAADELSATLFELGAQGVEERDDATLLKGVGSGRVTLVASFAAKEDAVAAIDSLREVDEKLAPRLDEVVGDAWRDAWKEHFAPFALTSRVTVAPPWVPYEKQREDEIVLVLEPGRAFGTGLHASTSLVAETLEERKDKLAGVDVLDLGCGSGILAFVALLGGAKHAVAIDIDADVVEVVRENAERNGLGARVDASAGTIADVTRAYPFVVANIEARILKPMAAELARVVEKGGRLVLSGILGSEHDAMVEAFTTTDAKLTFVGSKRRGDAAGEAWVAIELERPL